MLYQVAVVKKPTIEEQKNGKLEELLYFSLEPIVAASEKAAAFKIIRSDDPKVRNCPEDRLEVVVVPFG